MKKEQEIVYYYRGNVERWSMSSRGNPWRRGYSANSKDGFPLYPWSTKRECQSEAKKLGLRAVFVEDLPENEKAG